MKCVVVAGGPGERLWPLSRKNCPKQFMEIEKNHSIFQDTIARNIPYYDEFIFVPAQPGVLKLVGKMKFVISHV